MAHRTTPPGRRRRRLSHRLHPAGAGPLPALPALPDHRAGHPRPATLAAGLGDRVQAGVETAAATAEFIDGYTDKNIQPGAETAGAAAELLRDYAGRGPIAGHRQGLDLSAGRHLVHTGADFRALREVLDRLEQQHHRNWGGLSPVSRPEDQRIMYLCRTHLAELDYPYTAGPGQS